MNGLIALLIVAPDHFPVAEYLPFNLSWKLLKGVLADGKSIFQIPGRNLLFVLLQTIIFLLLSAAVYKWCEEKAKEKGILGQ